MSARQVVTFGSCCQSSTFGGFWDLCSFSDQILASSQSSTFGGFWDLDKIWSEKLHLFARLRISDRICEILTKSRGPPKVEDCKMELGPGSAGRGTRTTSENVRKCPKSYIFSPDFGHPAQVPTCSPVVSCLQSTLTTWLYIVTWLLLDRLSHLIGGGSKTCFGPKSG